ncbi:MFS transporter [Rhodococcoides fascians]|uniref:MFS transporter n=1 Tax=Rhodococcoides fascians TaxID=1828 RepID=UPI00068FE834|nr:MULTISPECIES: MFS transporter [Rhodococcus]OZE91300.1 MFS transporter [Rhodococcus sp. 15-1189-1-1a]OZF15588.1 MFS transporter [Rhodococcus sp. 14-2686-1-2]
MDERNTAGLLTTLTGAMAIGPLLTYGLSATGALVVDSLQISLAQFGLLASVTFLSASLTSLTLGRSTDRGSVRALLLFVFVGAGVSFVCAALSTNYMWLLVSMVVSGVAQSLSNPATNRAISENAPSAVRGQWVGIKQSGVQFSQFLAGLGCPAVALVLGWRGALWIGAALSVVGIAVVFFSWPRSPHARASGVSPRARDEIERQKIPVAVWVFAAYAFVSGAAVQATNVYLPLFAHDALGLSLAVGGAAAAAAGALGVASRILWGRALSGAIDTYVLLLILASGSAAGSLSLLCAGVTGWQALLWVGVALHGVSALAANVVLMAGSLKVVDASMVGKASSVIAVGMYFGFALGPALAGLLVDATGAFAGGWSMAVCLYLVCALLSGVGLYSTRRTAAMAERDRTRISVRERRRR